MAAVAAVAYCGKMWQNVKIVQRLWEEKCADYTKKRDMWWCNDVSMFPHFQLSFHSLHDNIHHTFLFHWCCPNMYVNYCSFTHTHTHTVHTPHTFTLIAHNTRTHTPTHSYSHPHTYTFTSHVAPTHLTHLHTHSHLLLVTLTHHNQYIHCIHTSQSIHSLHSHVHSHL